MAFELEGNLYKKFDVAQVTDSFKKREFVLESEDGAYTQLIKFQLVQANCDKLDAFNEGDKIKVTFSLKGREYKKDGNVSYFTNLDAWRVESAGAANAPAPTAAPAGNSFPSASDEPATDGGIDDDLPF